MSDQSSGRDASTNNGSDSAKHYGTLPIDRFRDSPKIGPATPTTAPTGSAVRDQKPVSVPGSAAK